MRYVLALFALFATFAGLSVAFAATGVTEDSALPGMVKAVFDAVRSGNGWLGAALALVLAVTAARRYGAGRFPFLASKAGGAAMNVLLSFGGAAATALAAGSAPSLALVLTALKVSVVAAGGFTLIKELAAPALRWAESKAPAWLKPVLGPALNLILWAFEGKVAAVKKAEKAGADAVKAKPATGAVGVVGKPEEWP